MQTRRFLPGLIVLFIGSGCAALIYEIVWFQLLQLVIGSSAISLGILLGTFMGGMCLGSLLLPRLIAARAASAARLRVRSRSASACCGVLILFGMPLVGGVYTALAGTGVGGIVFRAITAGICLLPPTMLMGATLPAISRWVKATPDGVAVARLLLRRQHRGRRRRLPRWPASICCACLTSSTATFVAVSR